MSQSLILNNILTEAISLAKQGQKLKVVFDIDSTLLDVNPRIYEVLTDFVKLYENQYKEFCEPLRNIKLGPKDYGLNNALIKVGLHQSPLDFLDTLKGFWVKNFFSSDYLHKDEPYEGAVEFVRELERHAQVIYLTGRDVERMGRGTVSSLVERGFPVNTQNTELILKPNKEMDDAVFKKDYLNSLKGPIWFIENEPENIHLALRECPHVRIVFFDSVHLGKAEAPVGLPTITSFAR